MIKKKIKNHRTRWGNALHVRVTAAAAVAVKKRKIVRRTFSPFRVFDYAEHDLDVAAVPSTML